MTILFEKAGDLFVSGLQTLVCPVNTVGAMGKGLALAFHLRYPGLKEAYQRASRLGVFDRDGYWVWDAECGQKILCLPSKRHWARPSKIDWIEAAFSEICLTHQDHGITSMALPAVGCGEGQLMWESVRDLIYHYFEHSELEVGVYHPL